jgi:hypothetical protein
MKHIGVTSHFRLPDLAAELKRYALFFDEVQIAGMNLERIREKTKAVDDQVAAEIEFLYERGFLKEGVIDVKSTKGLPTETAERYALNVMKMQIAGRYMKSSLDLLGSMKQLVEMIKDCRAKAEDETPLIALHNRFARCLATGMVEATKGLPLSARHVAMNLSLFADQAAVCLGDLDYQITDESSESASAEAIYEIAVEGLPIPDGIHRRSADRQDEVLSGSGEVSCRWKCGVDRERGEVQAGGHRKMRIYHNGSKGSGVGRRTESARTRTCVSSGSCESHSVNGGRLVRAVSSGDLVA